MKPDSKKIRHAVYWNTGEGRGGIEEIDMNDMWSDENPHGWTYGGIGGIHDTYIDDFGTREDAQTYLDSPLEEA